MERKNAEGTAAQVAPAVNALMHGIVDYAGLFPPEKLPLAEALASYASYQRHPYAGFLARFVLPASQFREAGELLQAPLAEMRAGTRPPWRFSALLKAQPTREALQAHLAGELEGVRLFLAAHGDVMRVDAAEIALPVDVCVDAKEFAEAVRYVGAACALALPEVPVSFEVPMALLQGDALALLRVLAAVPGKKARAKFRTGGLTPEAIPSPALLARVLSAAARSGCVSKYTAGLHDPLRHFDASVGAPLHGFLPVFFGAFFAAGRGWSESQVQALLESEHAEDFRLSDNGSSFTVRNETVSMAEIARWRETVATSFGSCSFLEPVDGLRQLGFLPSQAP